MLAVAARKNSFLGALVPCVLLVVAVSSCSSDDGNGAPSTTSGGASSMAGASGRGGSDAQAGRDAQTGGSSGGNAAGGSGGGAGQGTAGDGLGGAGGATAGAGGMAPMGGNAPVIAAGVRWMGRVDVSDAQAIKFAWSGSGFVGTFSGPVVSVKLKTVGGGDIFFQPVVDGAPGTRFSVGTAEKTVEIASGLGAGPHRVELYRETEGKGFGYSVFSGFAAGTPGEPPEWSGRLIEVVGDSISAGFGNLGSEQHPNYGPDPNGGCNFTTETESAYVAYGHVAARAVNADASVLAGSGWGIYSDNTGNTDRVMPALFGNVLGETATPAWGFVAQPQAVVINLGTNDASANTLTAENFKPVYTAFVTTIRGKYPDALILGAVGSMLSGGNRDNALSFVVEVFAALEADGDDKLEVLDLGTQDVLAGTGCSWHPNAAEDARMAGILSAKLKASLGW